jgi:hypothetical protein
MSFVIHISVPEYKAIYAVISADGTGKKKLAAALTPILKKFDATIETIFFYETLEQVGDNAPGLIETDIKTIKTITGFDCAMEKNTAFYYMVVENEHKEGMLPSGYDITINASEDKKQKIVAEIQKFLTTNHCTVKSESMACLGIHADTSPDRIREILNKKASSSLRGKYKLSEEQKKTVKVGYVPYFLDKNNNFLLVADPDTLKEFRKLPTPAPLSSHAKTLALVFAGRPVGDGKLEITRKAVFNGVQTVCKECGVGRDHKSGITLACSEENRQLLEEKIWKKNMIGISLTDSYHNLYIAIKENVPKKSEHTKDELEALIAKYLKVTAGKDLRIVEEPEKSGKFCLVSDSQSIEKFQAIQTQDYMSIDKLWPLLWKVDTKTEESKVSLPALVKYLKTKEIIPNAYSPSYVGETIVWPKAYTRATQEYFDYLALIYSKKLNKDEAQALIDANNALKQGGIVFVGRKKKNPETGEKEVFVVCDDLKKLDGVLREYLPQGITIPHSHKLALELAAQLRGASATEFTEVCQALGVELELVKEGDMPKVRINSVNLAKLNAIVVQYGAISKKEYDFVYNRKVNLPGLALGGASYIVSGELSKETHASAVPEKCKGRNNNSGALLRDPVSVAPNVICDRTEVKKGQICIDIPQLKEWNEGWAEKNKYVPHGYEPLSPIPDLLALKKGVTVEKPGSSSSSSSSSGSSSAPFPYSSSTFSVYTGQQGSGSGSTSTPSSTLPRSTS